ncbi:ATP-binding protein [Pseudosulfitobacter sp. SM2401]|uniref:sensor histidine kinase n=1 Tax=Pseudosulfitobacter sp. SM2401 TaxID=3350098 RepID=UPI0036F2140E
MGNAGFQSLLNALPLPGLAIDLDDRIIAANADARALLGDQIIERSYIAMLRQPDILHSIEATQADGENRTTRYVHTDIGQETLFSVSCRAVVDAGDTVVILCFEDITHVTQTSQMRRDFVANVSHELRTPLTALMGFIETLRGPAKNDAPAHDRFLGIMQSEAERMNRLVGDLLSLSQVESDERVRPTDNVCVDAVLLSTIHSIKPVADAAGVNIETDFSDSELIIAGDADQLRQVFTNLIGNAIKYGSSGGRVTVSLKRLKREAFARGPCALIQITDYGDGIDEVHLPRLTERFYRVDDHRSRALGGTGLGLAITKHIVNRHRGRLKISSVKGAGSTFAVVLPISA